MRQECIFNTSLDIIIIIINILADFSYGDYASPISSMYVDNVPNLVRERAIAVRARQSTVDIYLFTFLR